MKIKFGEETPLVSVCCIAYNHHEYISNAIEGFLSQKTTFPIEVIIHDDASNDGTADIIRLYVNKYPHLIKSIFQVENQYSKGVKPSSNFVWPSARGKYIALCEGDDYWTDPYKLQKQIDFLEANSEYSLCFHDAKVEFELDASKNHLFSERFSFLKSKDVFSHSDIIKLGWFMPTASMVFKRCAVEDLPDWFNKVYSGDYTLQMLSTQYGKAKYLHEVMCLHRKHPGGISQILQHTEKLNSLRIFEFEMFKGYFDKKYQRYFDVYLYRLYLQKYDFLKRNGSHFRSLRFVFKAVFLNTKTPLKFLKQGLKNVVLRLAKFF